MYEIELADTRGGRTTVTVRQRGRLVCSASIDFVRWMHEYVPFKQLREEQKALMKWYEKTSTMSAMGAKSMEAADQHVAQYR